jgi:hypothetical protein
MSQQALRDQNRTTTLIAKDDTDPEKTVAVTADPLTGALNTTVVTSVGTQYESGQVTPATPIGSLAVWDDDGTIEHVSSLKPLPVTASLDTTGLATETKQDSIITAIGNIQNNALTDTQLRATAVPISGTVNANTGLTQPLTDTQLRATAVPISGTVTANTGITQPLTNTELRASAVPVSISGNQAVNVAQINGVTTTMGNGTSGTGVQRVTVASDSTGQIIARGAAAHDAEVSGNPLLVGAEARSTDQTAVGTGDITRLQSTLTGKQVVLPYAIPENSLSGTASATGTSDTAIISAQGAGVRIYVTSIIISNSSDTDTEVVIKSATTARLTYPAPAKGGAVHALPTPLQLTANEALNFASLASVTTMKVSAVAYKGV